MGELARELTKVALLGALSPVTTVGSNFAIFTKGAPINMKGLNLIS